MKILIKPFVYLIDVFNYFAHLEGQRCCEEYEQYEQPKWIERILK